MISDYNEDGSPVFVRREPRYIAAIPNPEKGFLLTPDMANAFYCAYCVLGRPLNEAESKDIIDYFQYSKDKR